MTLVLSDGPHAETTATALRLAERLLARGSRVAVFARGAAAGIAAGDDTVARGVGALLRRGVHGATLDWVVDREAAQRIGVLDALVPGVVPGDASDLWTFIRDADVVLSPGGGT